MSLPNQTHTMASNSNDAASAYYDATASVADAASVSDGDFASVSNIEASVSDCSAEELCDRFISILDHMDSRVERFRKDAISLLDKKDCLLTAMDLIRNNDRYLELNPHESDEIISYMQRITARLATVDLIVRTVRDESQEEALHQVNALIDAMIRINNVTTARQYCKKYLCACSSSNELAAAPQDVDKKFENALLGCTLDDQKVVKRRLQALMDYLNGLPAE